MKRSIRRAIVRFLAAAAMLLALALVIEYALEARDFARFTPGQSFAAVGAARIRYQLAGAENSGATVVILSGINGSIEQAEPLQSALSTDVPSLAYDRAGYGFSQGSRAHTVEQQAEELAALLHALMIEKPVVLVGYSASAAIARVFAGRYPEKTAAIYLIDPPMPELDELFPQMHDTRRTYARFVLQQLVSSSMGYIRLTQRLHSWQGPESLVEQRAEAVLARRPHYWAVAKEWWMSPESTRQTIAAPVPPTLQLEVVFPKRIDEDDYSRAMTQQYRKLVARSSAGKLLELDNVDHWMLVKRGPVFDQMVARMKQLAKGSSP